MHKVKKVKKKTFFKEINLMVKRFDFSIKLSVEGFFVEA